MPRGREQRSWAANFVIEALLLFLLGWVVAAVMFPLHDFEFFKAIDRTVTDRLMRNVARIQLAAPYSTAERPPRFVFVDIGEESCRRWAKKTSCTLSMITSRRKLAEIADTICRVTGDGGGPKLVVFDIEFSPLPDDKDADEQLGTAILTLADKVDVIALRPMAFDPNSSSSRNIGYDSILDHEFGQKSPCETVGAPQKKPEGASQEKRLWFASPLIDSDPDGMVRSVHPSDEILIEQTHKRGLIPGIGFLGAALLESPPKPKVLRCYFNASNSLGNWTSSTGCDLIRIGGRSYSPTPADSPTRILFSLPYQTGDAADSTDYPAVPSRIETIEAYTLETRLNETPALLNDAVVIVGGSYWSSGDLHPVPLNASMPGAMVHANAIRAYTMARIVDERLSLGIDLGLEFLFISVAAIIGASSHLLASLFRGFFLRFAIAIAGTFCTFIIVRAIGNAWAFLLLVSNGKAIGVLTPALAIAIEGIYGQIRDQLHELVARAYFWMAK